MKVGHNLHDDNLVTVSYAPGYRHIGLHLELNAGDGGALRPVEVRLDAPQSRALLTQLLAIHRLAWGDAADDRPLDAAAAEARPAEILTINQPS